MVLAWEAGGPGAAVGGVGFCAAELEVLAGRCDPAVGFDRRTVAYVHLAAERAARRDPSRRVAVAAALRAHAGDETAAVWALLGILCLDSGVTSR